MAYFSHFRKSRDIISKQSQITCPGINSPNSPLGKTNLISDLHRGQKNEVNEDKQVNILCHPHCRCC